MRIPNCRRLKRGPSTFVDILDTSVTRSRRWGTPVTRVGRVSDGDGDLALHLAGDQLLHRVGGLIEWVGPVDARRDGTGVDARGQSFQIGVVLFRNEHGEPLSQERGEGEGLELAAHPRQCPATLTPDDDQRSLSDPARDAAVTVANFHRCR